MDEEKEEAKDEAIKEPRRRTFATAKLYLADHGEGEDRRESHQGGDQEGDGDNEEHLPPRPKPETTHSTRLTIVSSPAWRER